MKMAIISKQYTDSMQPIKFQHNPSQILRGPHSVSYGKTEREREREREREDRRERGRIAEAIQNNIKTAGVN